MRFRALSFALLAAGYVVPLGSPSAEERACTVSDCFRERDIRDFEVIDPMTLIVYTGTRRCAFLVELRGTFCDMTFAPEVNFRKPNEMPINGAIPPRGTSPFDPFDMTRRDSRRDLRVCSNDLQIDVDGGVFTESLSGSGRPPDRFGNPRPNCQLQSVKSITDDQILELYVKHDVVAPPPPMGVGEIQIGEPEEKETASE